MLRSTVIILTSKNFSYSKGVQATIFIMDKNLEKIADQYEGNLLNYFCGMTPKESKRFNKMVKDAKKNRRLN